MKNSQFKDTSNDPDTRILHEQEMLIENFICLFQRWSWEGIRGDSCIFHSNDLQAFSDEEIKTLIAHSQLESAMGTKTISRKENFIYVNFNFQH